MSAELELRCPVCRARQTLRETCRRCQADLRLLTRAHRRLAHLKHQRTEALAAGDDLHQRQLAAELRWLAPSR